jgi:hypothetical protein
VCPDGLVYDLETELGAYDANGTLVHNCHHYVADEWARVAEHYRAVRTVGATATPERSDGRPLGSYFQQMVVAANYSYLIEQGHILDCRLFAPPQSMPGGLAQDPVKAYQKWGEERSGYVFCGTVPQATEVTENFKAAGVPAMLYVAETDDDRRRVALEALASGAVKLLINVYCLAEGVNVPRAKVCILARGCGSVLTYLQMVGRVLRPFEGETHATLIDLHGSSLAHGFPTEDREFSLTGDAAISRKDSADALRQCLACGYVWPSATGPVCPECGWVAPPKIKPIRIYNEELREIYKGDATPPEAQMKELVRLKAQAGIRGYGTGWVVREYRRLFKKTAVPIDLFTPDEIDEYYEHLVGIARKKGYRDGWANGCFRSTFGKWHRRY